MVPLIASRKSAVMAGLVPAIHVFAAQGRKDVDARHKATAVRFDFCGQGA